MIYNIVKLFIVIIICIISFSCLKNTENNSNSKLEELELQIKNLSEILKSNNAQKDSIDNNLSSLYSELQSLKSHILNLENNKELLDKIKDLEDKIKEIQSKRLFYNFDILNDRISLEQEKVIMDSIDSKSDIIIYHYNLDDASIQTDIIENQYKEKLNTTLNRMNNELSVKCINYISMITETVGSISQVEEDSINGINYESYIKTKNDIIIQLESINLSVKNDKDITVFEYNIINTSIIAGLSVMHKLDQMLFYKGRFFKKIGSVLKKVASVVVSVVINTAVSIFSFSNNKPIGGQGLLGWVFLSPIRFVSGVINGVAYGVKCWNYSFSCITDNIGITVEKPTPPNNHNQEAAGVCMNCHK